MTRDATAPAPVDLPYRPCVGIALINRSGGVFVGRRKGLAEGPDIHAWQMPQGGIDAGEGPEAAAVRELREETDVASASLRPLGQIPDWLSYDLPPDVMKRSWTGRYRGQTQKWFAFGFLGTDAEIDVHHPGGGQNEAEFDAWRWADFSELPGMIVPFKRPVYEAVVAAFRPLATWSRGV